MSITQHSIIYPSRHSSSSSMISFVSANINKILKPTKKSINPYKKISMITYKCIHPKTNKNSHLKPQSKCLCFVSKIMIFSMSSMTPKIKIHKIKKAITINIKINSMSKSKNSKIKIKSNNYPNLNNLILKNQKYSGLESKESLILSKNNQTSSIHRPNA